MNLVHIWKRIIKQPMHVINHTKAIAFLDNKEYEITGIRYKNGKWLGFELSDVVWHDRDDYPKENEWIIIKDEDGKEYDAHRWVGHAYYAYVFDDDGSCDGWRSLNDIVAWRYDYDFKP